MFINTWKKLLFTTIIIAAFISVAAQENNKSKDGIKKLNVGVSFNMHDFGTKTIFPWKDSTYGFSVMIWKGITPKIDYSIRYNGVFPNQNKHNVISKNVNSSELEASIHAKAFRDHVFLNPFLTLGIGGGKYHKNLSPVVSASKTFTWNAHALGGGGLQFNIKNELYFLIQANYRYSFDDTRLPHNLFYSFGLSKSLYKSKKEVATVAADRDNDGIPDNSDICPDAAGPALLQGCPDKDGDGIADKDDKCPDTKGIASLNGCPDRDGDAIADNDDKCPDVKGIAKYQGCPIPDTDNDGINDEEDKCPNIAGIKENMGCPSNLKEDKKELNTEVQSILFVTGSTKLQNSSLKVLNEIAITLKEHPEIKLIIDGHTDNVGNEEMNQTLSEDRATTVKKYFISKGINESRIETAGHGELQPISENKSATGRQKNRRVELHLNY